MFPLPVRRSNPTPIVIRYMLLSVVVFAMFGNLPARANEPIALAIFEFELIDTSYEGEQIGPNPKETQRLALIGQVLRDRLAASGRFSFVDMTPATAKIAEAGLIHSCNGCDADIARPLGAQWAVTGTVQKVSNLILNINIYVRDTTTGQLVKAMSADVRGNTDESWAHGVKWLVRNRFLKR